MSTSATDASLAHPPTFSEDEQTQALGAGRGSMGSTLRRIGGQVRLPCCSLHVGRLGSWAGGGLPASPWLLPSQCIAILLETFLWQGKYG